VRRVVPKYGRIARRLIRHAVQYSLNFGHEIITQSWTLYHCFVQASQCANLSDQVGHADGSQKLDRLPVPRIYAISRFNSYDGGERQGSISGSPRAWS
jgi:hypothetical protein